MSQRTTMNGKPVIWLDTKTVLNLNSGFKQKLLCDGPTFTAGTACPYSCSFCYVPSQMLKTPGVHEAVQEHGAFENIVIRRTDATQKLEEALAPGGKPRYQDPTDRRVIYASPLTDVAANLELAAETVLMCKTILTHTHWQIRLLTKSSFLPWIAKHLENHSCAGEHQARQRMIFGVSTGTLNEKVATAIEEGTARVDKRIESIRQLQDDGWRTFGMVCPSLPMSQDELLEFAFMAGDRLRYDRMEHVWAEVINVRGESMARTVRNLEFVGEIETARHLAHISQAKENWEEYARATFLAHKSVLDQDLAKLRFLQYIDRGNREFWEGQEGVVCL